MELEVYNIKGEKTGKTVVLSEDIFGITPNDHAIYLEVKQIQANKRQGTHKSKERSEVSGSTRKLKRQKGTGGARAGDINNPLFRGGGRVFGPKPRDYSFKLNKKVKVLARKSALTYKAKENKITIVEDFAFDKPHTKSYLNILKGLNLADKKTLLVVPEPNANVYLSTRNLGNARMMTASELNTYDVLSAHNLIFTEGAIPVLEKNLTSKN